MKNPLQKLFRLQVPASVIEVFEFAFIVSIFFYFFLLLIENMQPGFVSGYIDASWWLWVAIITGAVTSMVGGFKTKSTQKSFWVYTRQGILLFVLVYCMYVIIKQKLIAVGWYGETVAIMCSIFLLGLGLLLWRDHNDAH